MPCSSGPSYDDKCDRLDAATRVACEMARAIRDKDAKMPRGHKGITMFSRLSRETKDWVRAHDEIDKKRLAREEKERVKLEAKRTALAKLSEKEKDLLNLRYIERDLSEDEQESESEESDE
jgi:hypothetical protein